MTQRGLDPVGAHLGALLLRRQLVSGWRLGLVVRFLVCHLLPVWCLFGLDAASAWASPADTAVPMCDPMGASVAVAPEIPEFDGGRLEALPCDALHLMAAWRPDAPEFGSKAAAFDDAAPQPSQQLELPRPRYEGACEVTVAFPTRVEPGSACDPRDAGLSWQQGHRSGVYRPPVAC